MKKSFFFFDVVTYKRLVYLVVFMLGLSMFLSVAPIIAERVQANTNWINYTQEFASGDGSANNPYLIKTPEQLAYLAKQFNTGNFQKAYFKLNNNISLAKHEWTPIGNSNYPFNGTFDGNGATIAGLRNSSSYTYNGLFGRTQGGTIKNLFLLDGHLNGSFNYVGTVAGYAVETRFEKIYSDVKITNTYSKGSSGGILGYGTSGVTMKTIANIGTVNSSNSKNVGGIAGYLQGSLETAYNSGSIVGSAQSAVDDARTGGVVGHYYPYYQKDNYNKIHYTIRDVYNSGEITGTHNVGGIIGYLDNNVYSSYTVLENSYNAGKIAANSGSHVGGVVGWARSSNIRNVYNTADVAGSYSVGGILGRSFYESSIRNASNTGNISGESYVAGIVAFTAENFTVDNTLNKGSVTASSYYAAGILAYSKVTSGTVYVDKNGNTGAVTAGTSHAAGIIAFHGVYSENGVTIYVRENYNTAKIKSVSRVGGIVGEFYRSFILAENKNESNVYFNINGEVANNTNIGIIGGDYEVGGIMAYFIDEKAAKFKIINNYYAGSFDFDFNKYANNSGMGSGIYKYLGSIVGADVYFYYTGFENNYAIIDFYQNQLQYSLYPIGSFDSYFGHGALRRYDSYYLENYFSTGNKIYIANYAYDINLTSYLGNKFTTRTEYYHYAVPAYARYELVANVLSNEFSTVGSVNSNGHPVIRDLYW